MTPHVKRHRPAPDDYDRAKKRGDVTEAARQLVAESERWMNTPHDLLGGEAPADLVARNQAKPVWDLLDSIRLGMFT